jgi:hypothetical protein
VTDPVARTTECATICDWSDQSQTECTTGTCVYDFGPSDNDLCIKEPLRIAPSVQIGESCPQTGYQVVCNEQNGYANGYCDPNNVCRKLCTSDTECTAPDHTCRIFEPPTGTLGYCGPVPTDN